MADVSSGTDIDPCVVSEQLERILASPRFAQSDRMCRFLRVAVEYALDSRASELKEYAIGLQVFDRGSSFDPRLDPIVRVEARRLRAKLNAYYEAEGAADPIRIEIPKGTYVPRFIARDLPPAPRHSAAARTGIAIIPFSNLSPGEDNEYFSDGLTQDLILGLTRVPGLRVVAWTSAVHLRGESDFAALGQRLDITAVLTGSVRRVANRVRVTAQLVDTATSGYLWTDAYDRELRDLLEIQDEISRAIVNTLRIHLAEPTPPSRAAYNFEAHNLCLRARFEANCRSAPGLRTSLRYFEEATQKEPGFGLAWAGLAETYTLLAEYGVETAAEAMPRARHAALRAVELDSSLGEAWNSLALVRGLYEWERADAEECFRKAIRLNPGYSTVHHWFSVDHLALLGRFDEAFEEIRVARMLDPWAAIIIEGEAFLNMLLGNHDEAIRIHQEALNVDPAFHKALTSAGRTYIQTGEYSRAIEMLEKGRAGCGDMPSILGALGQAHALNGDEKKARCILASLEAEGSEAPFVCRAIVRIGLGEKEEALAALEIACERRELAVNSLNVHPVYDPLRKLPRFEALLHRLRFTAPAGATRSQ